jgi:Fibronectin type III domain
MSVELALSYPVRRFLLYLAICAGFWNLIEVPSEGVTTLTVMWNKSTDTNVQGYKLYYGTTSQQYTNSIVAGNVTNALAAGITPGVTYYFAVTSYDAAGWESSYSPEISYTVPLISPAGTVTNAALSSAASSSSGFNFSVNGTAASLYVVVASTNLTVWVAVATNTSPFVFTDSNASNYSRRFYKAILASAYVAPVAPTTPWPDATNLGNGWEESSWFGTFNVTDYPWIYHQQHGWMYVYGTDPASIWLWTSDMGFLWTGSGVYPWLWSDTQQTWLYYSVGSSNPRYFYNWNTQKWVAVNP